MKPEELQNAPKLFCENIKLGYTPEYFVLALSSGTQAGIYSLTPQHTKRLLQYLSHEIAQYESKYGSVHAEWNPNIKSPIQGIHSPDDKS